MLLTDIPYTTGQGPLPSPQRTFDLQVDAPEVARTKPLIVFVHGGAWIADDKKAHRQLAERLATATGCAVALPNYSLSPRGGQVDGAGSIQHPAHAQDVLLAFEFLRTWDGTPAERQGQADAATPCTYYDARTIFAIGHSCAGHILSSLFLAPSQSPDPLAPSPELLRAVRGIVTTEGIFDIDLLLRNFPAYKEWFIASAFGARDSYEDVSATHFDALSLDIAWLLIHSKGDTLVDRVQSSAMYDRLVELHGDGKRSLVEKDWETFETEHDDTLHTDALAQAIASFVEKHATRSE